MGLDLRAEPIVISVPEIEKKRYTSIQFIDAYTFNFACVGSRATGNDVDSFLIAGPNWNGEKPDGIKEVIRSETDFDMDLFRTQLFNLADIDNVKKIQAQYKVQSLSAFLGKPAPPAAPTVDWIKPLTQDEEKTSLEFFSVLNFVFRYCPTVPSEIDLIKRFAKIGVGGGMTFDPGKLSPEIKTAIEEGHADAYKAYAGQVKLLDEGKLTLGDLFGACEFLMNNYLYRWVATIGIYGKTKQEAMYPLYRVDAEGKTLTGTNRYTLHFAPGKYPPVKAFWSITMYDLPQSVLVANPINRYLINSPMLPDMTKNADGSLTLYIQKASSGNDKEANWLPAPDGPAYLVMRLYLPKTEAPSILPPGEGTWKPPGIVVAM